MYDDIPPGQWLVVACRATCKRFVIAGEARVYILSAMCLSPRALLASHRYISRYI